MYMALLVQMDMIEQLRQPNIEGPVQKLYEQYFEEITRQVCANGGNRDDGSDIFQEAVLVLIEKVRTGQFRGESGIRTFLSAIARNLWLHELRTRSRRNNREVVYMNGERAVEQSSERFIAGNMTDQLERVLEQVGEPCRKILTGFYYENKSMREILVDFDYENEQVLRNRKTRCMKKLKSLIASQPELLTNLKSYFVYE